MPEFDEEDVEIEAEEVSDDEDAEYSDDEEDLDEDKTVKKLSRKKVTKKVKVHAKPKKAVKKGLKKLPAKRDNIHRSLTNCAKGTHRVFRKVGTYKSPKTGKKTPKWAIICAKK